MTGNMNVKLTKDVVIDEETTEYKYSLVGDFTLNFSNHGTTTVTPPTVDDGDYDKITLLLVVRDLHENTSYREVLEIPYFTEDIEIVKGEHTFRYDSEQRKIYISPIAVNYLLGIIDYEKVENPDRTMSFGTTLAGDVEVAIKILYLPEIL